MGGTDPDESSATRYSTILGRLRDPYTLVGVHLIVISTTWALAWANGWKLVGDDAFIMMRADDVFSSNTPLRGMPSSFNAWSTAADPFHPGPVPFWVFAPATWLFGPTEAATFITSWVLVVAAIAISVHITQTLLGSGAAMWAAVVTVGHQAPLAFRGLWSPLTPIQGANALLALCFITWAIAAGRTRWWPAWIAVASFTAQTELSFVVTVAALGLLALASTTSRWRSAFDITPQPVVGRRTIVSSIAIAVACWTPVVVDAAANDGGNLRQLWLASNTDLPVAGWQRSLYSLWFAVNGALWTASDKAPLAIAVKLLVVLVAFVAAVSTFHQWRRRLRPAFTVAATALVATAVAQAFTPSAAGLQPLYLLGVGASGAFAWIPIGFAASRAKWMRRSRWVAAVLFVAASNLIVSAGAFVPPHYLDHLFAAVDPLSTSLASNVKPGVYEWQPLCWPDVASLAAGVGLGVDNSGIELRVEPALAKFYGEHHRMKGDEIGTLYVTCGAQRPFANAQMVARWTDSDRRIDPTAVQQAARAVRASEVEFASRSSVFFVGSVIAGTADHGTQRMALDHDRVGELGMRYWERPDTIKDLSDDTIAALLDQELIVNPPGWTKPPEGLGSLATVTIWLVTEQ